MHVYLMWYITIVVKERWSYVQPKMLINLYALLDLKKHTVSLHIAIDDFF